MLSRVFRHAHKGPALPVRAAGGALIGLLASIKLTPVVFAWWLIVHRRWRALTAFGGTCLALAALTVFGSDLDVFGQYLTVIGAGFAAAPGPFSLAGVARVVGLPAEVAVLLPRAAVILGLVAIVVARRRPRLGYGIAGALLWLGSPAAAAHTPALLLAALAPLIGRASESSAFGFRHRPTLDSPVAAQTAADAQ